MKKYLILVKHSLPEIAENLPACEWTLSSTGRERAQRLAKRVSRFQPEIIVSSVEPKAKGTAEIVANHLGLEFQVMQGLHEHDRSTMPYLSRDEFRSAILVEKENIS